MFYAHCTFRLRTLSAAILLCLTTAGHAADPQAVRYYEDAVKRFNGDDLRGAMIQLKNALQRDPGQLSAKILMGRTYLALSRPHEAEEELLQAQKLGADPYLTLLPLARARNALGKYDLNVEQLVPTEIPRVEQPDVWVELGIARLKSGDAAGAEIAFREATTIAPFHEGGTVGLAEIELAAGRFVAAERLAGDMIDFKPDSSRAWFTKGSALHAQGKHIDAATAYARASDLTPNFTAAALGEATALLDAGQVEKAAARLESMREAHPWVAEAPYLHAKALQRLGKEQEARDALAASAEILDPIPVANLIHNPALLRLAGMLAAENDRPERAYHAMSSYLKVKPDDVDARKSFARIALSMNKPAEVKRALVPMVTAGMADAELLGLLGDASAQAHDFVAAESYYREALANHRGGPLVAGRLGALQYRQGQREQALETLQAATDLGPQSGALGVSLYAAMLNYAEGRLDKAAEINAQVLSEQPGNLNALNLRAALAISRKEFDDGRRHLDALLARAPTFRPARYNLAKLEMIQGRYGEAEKILNVFLTDNANDQRALQQLARLEIARKNPRAAIKHYEKIREINPKALVATTELIELYIAESRPADAMKTALSLNRELLDNFHAHATLAAVQILHKEPLDARTTLSKAYLLAGYDPKKLMRTASLQLAARAHDDAVTTLTKLLDEQPRADGARLMLADTLFGQDKLADAKQQLEQILSAKPDNIRALAMMGDIKMAENQPETAAASYARAIAIEPRPELLVSELWAKTSFGEGDKALQELEGWQSQHPDTPVVLRTLAERHHQLGKTNDALDYYRRLLALTPDDAGSLNNMANLLMDIDVEQAFKAARRAIDIDPGNPAILDTMGWALIQIGDHETGIAHLRDALARNSRSATTRYHLGAALEEYGSRVEARRQLQQALRLGGDSMPWATDAQVRLQRLN